MRGAKVPASEYASLKIAIGPLFQKYLELTSAGHTEFKHSEFKRIEYSHRRRLALKLRDSLVAHGAFIAGFFTPLRAFVLERVRLNVSDELPEVPQEHQTLYETAAKELRGELDGPGAAGVIARFMSYPVGAAANMLAHFDGRFRLYYDPRETSEDRAVAHDVAEFMRASESVFKVLGGRYLGAEHGRTSEQELGLQLADLVAGETRHFFQANDNLMSFGSSLRLITPESEEPIQAIKEIHGINWKIGAIHQMPTLLLNHFERPDSRERHVFPSFRPLLASGILACYATYGHPRQLMPFDRIIFDQVE